MNIISKDKLKYLEQPNKRVPGVFYTEDVSPDRIRNIFHKKTRNRKHLGTIIIVGDTVIASAKTFFKRCPRELEDTSFAWSLSYLEKKKDPVAYMVSSFRTKSFETLYDVKSIHKNVILVRKKHEKQTNFVTLPHVPKNAVLISLHPLMWLQIGRCKVLFTDGRLWLSEPVGECNEPWLIVKKEDSQKYTVRISLIKVKAIELYGTFTFEPGVYPFGGRMVKENKQTDVVFSHDWKYIFIDGQRVIEKTSESSEYEIGSATIDELSRFAFMNRKQYFPIFLLKGVII